jgi:hypothetical protein
VVVHGSEYSVHGTTGLMVKLAYGITFTVHGLFFGLWKIYKKIVCDNTNVFTINLLDQNYIDYYIVSDYI